MGKEGQSVLSGWDTAGEEYRHGSKPHKAAEDGIKSQLEDRMQNSQDIAEQGHPAKEQHGGDYHTEDAGAGKESHNVDRIETLLSGDAAVERIEEEGPHQRESSGDSLITVGRQESFCQTPAAEQAAEPGGNIEDNRCEQFSVFKIHGGPPDC